MTFSKPSLIVNLLEELVTSGKKIFVTFPGERECLLIQLCLQQLHGEVCEMPFCIIFKTLNCGK